jgi:bacteriocin-like protein
MTNKNSLNNVVALNKFSSLTEDEMIKVEGGK